MIYLDSPYNVGYSWCPDCPNPGDQNTAEAIYKFLVLFFEKYSARFSSPVRFYIAGESYAGHYVPFAAQEIIKQNK